MSYQRDDLIGMTRCPSELSEFLARFGGINDFGEPRWRLVLASSVFWKVAGGNVWDDSLSVSERGGMMSPNQRPLRNDYGKLVLRPRFAHVEGWLLQVWKSASFYSREFWHAPENCMPDGTPKLGPFPIYGDYECACPPMLRLPTLDELGKLMNRHWRALAERTGSPEQRAREAYNNQLHEDLQREKKLKQEFVEYANDVTSYQRSYTLTAGRLRVARGEKVGIRSHIGN